VATKVRARSQSLLQALGKSGADNAPGLPCDVFTKRAVFVNVKIKIVFG